MSHFRNKDDFVHLKNMDTNVFPDQWNINETKSYSVYLLKFTVDNPDF